MRQKTILRSFLRTFMRVAIVLVLAGFGYVLAQNTTRTADNAASLAFRSAAVPPPPGYHGPLFKLSRDFPTHVPTACADCAWLDPKLSVNFKTSFPAKQMSPDYWTKGQYAEYIKRIIDYVKEEQDPNLADAIGWKVNVKGKTRWFNVPWMAVDPTSGREYIHGTTNERTAHLTDLLDPTGGTKRGVHTLAGTTDQCKQKFPYGFESWSVGYYNEWGANAIGRAFPVSGRATTTTYNGTAVPDGLPFPQGTMVVKILTTSAPEECVPFLKDAPAWTVDRHVFEPTKGYMCDRTPQISHVVQVDVAVVDSRNPNRWVYGTFVYNGNKKGATFWDRLQPLGLQWGGDPWTFPAVPKDDSQPLQETVLNPDVNLPEHQGCYKRLAGPVDNGASSCYSCHASGYAAPKGALSVMGTNIPPSFGFPGLCQVYSLDNAAYFQDVLFPQSFPGGRYPDALSMDTSLQLAVAFRQFGLFNTKTPQQCTNPNQ